MSEINSPNPQIKPRGKWGNVGLYLVNSPFNEENLCPQGAVSLSSCGGQQQAATPEPQKKKAGVFPGLCWRVPPVPLLLILRRVSPLVSRAEQQTGRSTRRHGSQRQQQAAVRGRPAPPGLQQEPLGQVHRALLRKCPHRLCHPHLWVLEQLAEANQLC